MAKIAIEATGSDKGFMTVFEGAKQAFKNNPSLEIILVAGEDELNEKDEQGKPKIILNLDEETFQDRFGMQLVKTPATYSPENERERTAVYRAIQMHKDGLADIVIAPGDTRGAVSCSKEILGLMNHVIGQALPTSWPNKNVLIDSGSDIRALSQLMLQYAIMGRAYSKYYLGVDNPIIGMVTIGEEKGKGNRFIQHSIKLIKTLEELGYKISKKSLEGNFFKEFGHVAVTDGHTGNIGLKMAEEGMRTGLEMFRAELYKQNFFRRILAKYVNKKPLTQLKEDLKSGDYTFAPLLGIDGNVLICHGASDSTVISNAIISAEKYLHSSINERLKEEFEKYSKIKPDQKEI